MQIQTWMGKDLPPDEWGWENTGLRENTNTGLRPIKMARPAAPDKFLKIIKCCSLGYCDPAKCTCRKNGLKFSPARKNCIKGTQLQKH